MTTSPEAQMFLCFFSLYQLSIIYSSFQVDNLIPDKI
ncbi:hypothetical protein SLEP1_g47406 [Rubroshorea leprosula]|uniref:Uncharacterized protein n=1 Tax=Rubroshorea leprosula TaxID=152421 RepID=A0AAV5LQD4_9ROSI|nr:hypothetical protein SLEP1_g47406 [Rubroshorea leprosula]